MTRILIRGIASAPFSGSKLRFNSARSPRHHNCLPCSTTPRSRLAFPFCSQYPLNFNRMSTQTWRSIAARKQAERQSRIPTAWILPAHLLPSDSDSTSASEGKNYAQNVADVPRICGLLSLRELEITEKYDATALAGEIRKGRLRCVEVAGAFCKVGFV